MAEESNWDDIFAKAADLEVEASSLPSSNDAGSKKKRSKKRKRKRSGHNQQDQDVFLEATAQDPWWQGRRTESVASLLIQGWSLLSWMEMGESCWGSSHCPAFQVAGSSSTRCDTCHQSRIHHRLQLTAIAASASMKGERKPQRQRQPYPHDSADWQRVLQLVVGLRNLRCAIKVLLLETKEKGKHHDPIQQYLQKDVVTIEECVYQLYNQHNQSTNPFAELLDCVKTLQQLYASATKTSDGLYRFDVAIEILLTCDMAYYRLYYETIALLPSKRGEAQSSFRQLPHPSTYFGLDGFTIDLSFGSDTSSTVLKKLNQSDFSHPLATIWCARWLEHHTLFISSGWSSRSETRLQLDRALSDPELAKASEKHETPAPTSLRKWRDGCRDFMCHIYAYATVSTTVLQDMTNEIKKWRVSTVLEIGAGTGYLASLLVHSFGLSVTAWDSLPSNGHIVEARNEYHGHSPPFHKIQRCNGFPVEAASNCRDTCLLLCYPPPNDPMAYDTLRTFLLQHSGRCLIHIGEFKGLTGEPRFEAFLLEHMTCSKRLPTLRWGTDASEVTLWTKKKKKDYSSPSSLLLPCSSCGSKEGKKRCRMFRELVFCSAACLLQHSSHRKNDDTAYDSSHRILEPVWKEQDWQDDKVFLPL